jgi:HAD superfamily hydrolase (TIGR01509 family)
MEEFVGQNFRGMLIALKEKFQYEMDDAEKETYVTKEEDQVIQKINERLRPCPGAKEELQKLANKGKYRMVVVSSSAKRRAIASLEKVGLEQYFLTDDIFSAATSLPVPTSKPDPAIYLHALEVLGKKREECVAVEDSKSGVMSSARAGIKCVGYVGSYAKEKQENMAETLKNAGACSIMKDWTELDYHVEKIEKGEI